MDEETIIRRLLQLNEQFQAQWDADVAAVRAQVLEEEGLPLRMGDLFNTLKERWHRKMTDLAKEAGVSPHTARQRARIAARIPPGSPIRALGLPFSILRLLASLPDAEPWAERARVLRDTGELNVRSFARLLEDAGLRRRRASRPLRCLHCGREIPEHAPRVYLRLGDRAGRFCDPHHAAAYLTAPAPAPPAEALPAAAELEPALPARTRRIAPGEDTGSHRIASPFPPGTDTPARLLTLLASEAETAADRHLCRVPLARLTVPTARAPATDAPARPGGPVRRKDGLEPGVPPPPPPRRSETKVL